MVSSTSFVSLLMTICLMYSMTLLRARAHTLPHPQVPLGIHKDDGTLSANYFADFLRVLYAPQAANDDSSMSVGAVNEMPNDVFPLITPDAIELVAHEDIYESNRQEEFPSEGGVLLPILQKRNARYCGSYLADALRMACSRSSYLPLFGKRSIQSAGKSVTTTAASPDTELGTWPFIADDKAHSILNNQHLFHRFTRGVHDECCVKGCTFKELTSYCTRPN
ncbi:uncharacterized protein LOC123467394 [Daphnia magna]|uniref:Uncharacterized protein n=2 Tax=Daphnia magna TaxID=35525 RepID=A0ABQ9ZM25_9CRUS|nr:uncharacterized protein LOC116932919 [Daphnia magna]XP_045023285.1 uncharacterized protein LOC123467394 [Daphnia magna]KAK4013951.1 hypothetical protein OUZ56_026499 [Daphnia magna]KZS08320.1 Insulin/IGF/relaxin peptide 2-like protein [Daphnia magna]